jgi:hypothetical protein
MVRTQKNSRTVGIQANVCSTGKLLKDSCQETGELSVHKGTFRITFRTYENCQEYISQKTGVFSEYDWTDYTWELSGHQVPVRTQEYCWDTVELSGFSRTVRMQHNCQDVPELPRCSRTVRMQQNFQDAVELSGCSRTFRVQQNCQDAP